jgi:hypothetical protein
LARWERNILTEDNKKNKIPEEEKKKDKNK